MHEQGTPKVETQEDAVQVLLAWQVERGGIETQPASALTEETDAGWAFFNANGYMGTVTPEGEVVSEEQFAEDDN
jgi:hypothetical protein